MVERKPKTKDDYETIAEKKIRIGQGYYAKLSARREKSNGKITLGMYRPFGEGASQNFTFGKKSFMDAIIDGLKELEKKAGWKLSSEELQVLEKDPSRDISEALEIAKRKIRKKEAQVKDLSDKLNAKEIAAVQTEKFNNVFKETAKKFEETMKEEKEHKIQKFLSEHLWLISPEYFGQANDKIGNPFDFKVKKLDGFYDIVEIKKPTEKLFTGSVVDFANQPASKSPAVSGKVKESLFQLMEYLERESNITQARLGSAFRSGNMDETEVAFKPKGILIIGKLSEDVQTRKAERRLLRQFNSYMHGIEVTTYTQLLERGQYFAELKETVKK